MRWALLPLSLLAVASHSVGSIALRSSHRSYRNVAYLGNWAAHGNFTAQQLPVSSLTHIIYAFADINPDTGEVFLTELLKDTGSLSATSNNLSGNLQQLYLLKKQNRSLKVLLSIGGQEYSSHFASPASNGPGRLTFALSILSLIENLGLDGVDIDWEYPANAVQATDMVQLIKAVSNTLAPYNYTISVACPGPFGYTYLLLAEMDQYVDFWNLMAYDYTGLWSNVTGDQANLFYSSDHPESTPFATESVIDHYTSNGISPTKIVLGIPLYGRYFNSTGGLGKTFSGEGTYSVKNLPLRGATTVYDSKTGSSYSYDTVQRQIVSYDSIEVAKQKAVFIRNRLGGAMYWESSGDGEGGESIIQTVSHVLKGDDGLGLDSTSNQLLYPDSTYDNIRHGMPDSNLAPLSSTLPLEISSTTGSMLPLSTSCSSALMPTTALTASIVTSNTMNALVPGEAGLPGCAYVLVDDLGPNPLCPSDYCNCGGTAAPLLTSFVSGTSNLNCNYQTQPETNACPTTSTRVSRAPVAFVTVVNMVVVTCIAHSGSQTCSPLYTTLLSATSSN